MLHRSFKPAKCKTSLKLASSRLKLLKNKKGVQLNQMKRELAQLLESGQDQTARIRVEHVIREEKMIAAYDLVELYCELIVARLPIIESQKNCPIDLKEAITSVVFASPRCADIPELLDVRKHFTTKYGKEFISAAIELRPDCGVSRMLVEKLSAMAPDGPTKIKVLNAIAEEHNIKWEPKSFGEKDTQPSNDLLNGPNTFEKASKMHVEPPKFQAPNVQAPHSRDQKHDESLNFSEQNIRSSLDTQKFSSTDTGGIKTSSSATSHPDVRTSGMGSERMEVGQSFPGDGNAFSLGRQNWNMEFKDATSAAQAAAEAAERASKAARAAAELSSQEKITRQYSTETHKSNIHGLRDEEPGEYNALKFPVDHLPKAPANNSFLDRNTKLQNEQIDGNEHDNLAGAAERFNWEGHGSFKRSSQSASLSSNKASIDDDTLVSIVQMAEEYSQNSSFEEAGVKEENPLASKMSMKKQTTESEAEFVSGQEDVFKSANSDYFEEERVRKQSSPGSSRSHSGTFGDDYNVSDSYHQRFGNEAAEDLFVGTDERSVYRDTIKTSSYDGDAVPFDGFGIDGDSYRFDMGPKYDEEESSYFASIGRESPTRPSTHTNSWSPRRNTSISLDKSTSPPHFFAEGHSSPTFSESSAKSVDFSQPNKFVPVTFDDSDGPNSGSEDELEKSRRSGTKDSSILPSKPSVYSVNLEPRQSESHGLTGSSFAEKRNLGSDTTVWLRSSSDDLDSMEIHPKNNQGTKLNADSPKNFNLGESLASQPSLSLGKSRLELNDSDSESSLDNGMDEGNHLLSLQSSRLLSAYEVKDKVGSPVSPNTLEDDEFINLPSSENGKELNFGTLTGGLRNKGYRHPPYTKSPSGDVSSSSKRVDEASSTTIVQTAPATGRSSFNSSMIRNVDKKSSSSVPITSSDSDTDNSREEFPQQTPSSRQEPYAQKARKEVNMKSTLRAPVTFFYPDSDDSDEEIPKETFTGRGRLAGSGFSRRTKATSTSSETSSFSEVQVGSEASVNSNSGAERKPTRSSYGAETLPKLRYQTGASGQWGSREQPSLEKQAAPKPRPESKTPVHEGSLNPSAVELPSSPLQKTVEPGNAANPKTSNFGAETSTRENTYKKSSHVHPNLPAEALPKPGYQTGASGQWGSREQPSSQKHAAPKPRPESKTPARETSLKPSAVEQRSSPLRKTVEPGNTANPMPSNLGADTSTTENTDKKSGHVHPKLPDYDTLTAHLQSLRTNRQ